MTTPEQKSAERIATEVYQHTITYEAAVKHSAAIIREEHAQLHERVRELENRIEAMASLWKGESKEWRDALEDLAKANTELITALENLLTECRYSITSGLPFMESWTQFTNAASTLERHKAKEKV